VWVNLGLYFGWKSAIVAGMETSSNFDRAAASKARMAQERIEQSNARVAARRNPAKNHYLTMALSFVLALSMGLAGWSFVLLADSRTELARVVKESNMGGIGLGPEFMSTGEKAERAAERTRR
jgi:hypothetical protein